MLTLSPMNDLEKMTPASVEVKVGGEILTVSPIRVKELPQLMRVAKPFEADLNRKIEGKADIIRMLAAHPDNLIEAVAICCRKPVEWVHALELDEFVQVALAVIGVNSDFFIQKVLPAVQTGMQNLSEKLDGLNLTSSSGNLA